MGLFLPAMEALSGQGRWQVFIAPPYTPYAPLLAARGIDTRQVLLVHPRSREDLLWSTEQALRSTTCSAVFSWLGPRNHSYGELRKLQLAAASGDSLAVLFRPNQAAGDNSPASLRLQMREYRRVHILKQRGSSQHVDVDLPPAEDVPHQPQLWELPVFPDDNPGAGQTGLATSRPAGG
jgi:protein ImuA